jgi:di/tricarboxylate transporter
MSPLLKLNWNDVISAVISAVIVSVIGYLSTVTNITDIDYKTVLNIAFLTGLSSLLKALGTTESGNFLGAIKLR